MVLLVPLVMVAGHEALTISRESSSKESVTLGRRWTSPPVHLLEIKLLAYTVLVPKFGSRSSFRRRTIFELIQVYQIVCCSTKLSPDVRAVRLMAR